MIKPTYNRNYARDFCLPLIECWINGETVDPRQWTNKVNPELPYQVFIRENGLVTIYLNQKGLDWVNAELKQLMEKDPNFASYATSEFNKRASKVKPIWENRKILNREELVEYLKDLRDIWAWFEAIWWIMEMVPENSEEFKMTHTARFNNEGMCPDSDILIRDSLLKIYPELGELSYALLTEEIASNTIPAKEELQARMNKYSYANGKLYTDKGVPEMEEMFNIQIITSEAPEDITEFKGQIAQKGFARGKVRVIKKLSEVSMLQEGEILVSPMTMPDYVPAMKISAAIVTDEGGVTCHAAIVSRELKKPCVIGTKIATEVLKDGMEIEVDANNGIVKIINK